MSAQAIRWEDERENVEVGRIGDRIRYRIEHGRAFARLTVAFTGECVDVAPLHMIDVLKDAAERHHRPS